MATAEAIVNNNGIPVPADIASDHTIDPNDIMKRITKKTKFIMPVQLNGRTSNMDPIMKIANEYNLTIIEDSAQSLGAKYKGKFAGTFGRASSFSFYPAKILGAFGDAGIIITNDDDIAQKSRFLKDHGRNEKNEVVLWGMNSRLDNLQAAILKFQFSFFNITINRRRAIAELYNNNLKNIPQLTLPPGPDSSTDYFDVFQNYEIEAENRDGLKSHLADCGIGTLIQWSGKAVHQFEQLGLKVSLPFTEKMFTRCLMLPMHVYLSDDDIYYITEKIIKFYE
ncbi:MAG: cell wall biogenesis protein, partial [Ignavibacteria bacterium RBG_13_36_8]